MQEGSTLLLPAERSNVVGLAEACLVVQNFELLKRIFPSRKCYVLGMCTMREGSISGTVQHGLSDVLAEQQ